MKDEKFVHKEIVIAWMVGLCVSLIAGLSTVAVYASSHSSHVTKSYVTKGATKSIAQTNPGSAAASISGQVIDANGPIVGATVRVQATENSTVSAQDGSFTLFGLTGSGLSEAEAITVTAWAPGYYNGVAFTLPGVAPITITLNPYYTTDNHEYNWRVQDGLKGSEACGMCHTAYEDWKADAHGQSAINPRFLSMYAGTDVHGNKSPQPEKTNLGIPLPPDLTQPYHGPGFVLDFPNRAGNCSTCHTPIAARIPNNKNCGWSGCHASSTSSQSYGVLDPGVSPMPLTGLAAEGISCEFCHKTGEVQINRKSGLPYEDSPGILSMRLYRPNEGQDILFGPLDDVIGTDSTHIIDTYLPLMSESEFCAGCHYGVMGGVVGKMEVTGGVLVYNSYGEWLDSPYSDPETGQTCQDCHMPAMEDGYFVYPEQAGIFRDGSQIHNHQMAGASDPEMLQNSVTLSTTATVQDGWVWVNVNITNDGAGHHVPTDSPLRQMLLVVEAKDKDGKPLSLKYGSELPEWAGDLGGLPGKAFAKVLQDEWTGEMPTGAIWRPVRIVSDTRLPALKTDFSMYMFPVQGDTSVTVEARLIYRRAYQQLAEWKGWTDADIIMAQQTVQLLTDDLTSP